MSQTEVLACSRCGGQVSSMSNSGDEVIRSYAHPGAEAVVIATCAACREEKATAKKGLAAALERYRKDPSDENHLAFRALKEKT